MTDHKPVFKKEPLGGRFFGDRGWDIFKSDYLTIKMECRDDGAHYTVAGGSEYIDQDLLPIYIQELRGAKWIVEKMQAMDTGRYALRFYVVEDRSEFVRAEWRAFEAPTWEHGYRKWRMDNESIAESVLYYNVFYLPSDFELPRSDKQWQMLFEREPYFISIRYPFRVREFYIGTPQQED